MSSYGFKTRIPYSCVTATRTGEDLIYDFPLALRALPKALCAKRWEGVEEDHFAFTPLLIFP